MAGDLFSATVVMDRADEGETRNRNVDIYIYLTATSHHHAGSCTGHLL